MKTILTTINAKYIHTSLALRLLYTVAKENHDVQIKEYTLKENLSTIAKDIISCVPQIVALSVSIWNVEQTKTLIYLLKQYNPKLIIIIGGPEVSYEPDFFIHNWQVDYIVRGEGEFVLDELLHQLKSNKDNYLDIQIESVYTKSNPTNKIAQANLKLLESYDSPYTLDMDKEDRKNKILYFETSRGCPYQCQYCLSSLEKGVRYFSKSYITNNLKEILLSDVQVVKFLDRTFNLNISHTAMIFNCLLEYYRPNLSCQFEIYADILNPNTIEELNLKLPDKYFRFEIGIQSTHEPTNIAVKRKQDFALIKKNIKLIMDCNKIDLHLDLIAGLPYETLDLFKKSFNDVFDFGAKEIQLGFLKMLRGTNLRKDADKYNYHYESTAPYEIISNTWLSEKELQAIHAVENMLDKYWNSNKFPKTLNHVLFSFFNQNYYSFFEQLAHHYNQYLENIKILRLEDLFEILHQFLCSKNLNVFDLLRLDYYNNYIIRPHGFWKDTVDKSDRKRILYRIGNDKEFVKTNKLTRKQVEKQMTIDLYDDNNYLLTYFDGQNKEHQTYSYPIINLEKI